MAVAIRGTTPGSTIVVTATVSLTLSGSRQPQAGDVLLIVHCNDFYALSNMPTPSVGGSTSGVTAVTNGTADGGANGAHAKAFTYNVASTGDLTVSVTETGSADEEKALVVYVLSGVDTSTPVDVAGNATNTGSTTHTCPSVSPTSSDAYLICHTNPGGGAAPASYTHPSGMTETLDTVSGGLALGGAVLQLSASGATGSKTFTPSNSITASANLSIAIKTAGGAAAADSSGYTQPLMPGIIGPDGLVFLNRYDDTTTVAAVTGIATVTQQNQTSTATGQLGYSGTSAQTQQNQTSTATGQLGYSGTSATTQANQTSSATGQLGYSGTSAQTQQDQTSSASGTVLGPGISGSAAVTQQNQTSTATGQLGYSGTSARTQQNQTSTATGQLGYSGTSATTQQNQTSSATGIVSGGPISGTAAVTQANQTSTASGTVTAPPITGTAAITQQNQTATATGVAVGAGFDEPERLELMPVYNITFLTPQRRVSTLTPVRDTLTLVPLED